MRDMAVLAEECKIDPEFQAIPLFFLRMIRTAGNTWPPFRKADLKVEMKQPEEIGATIATYIGPGGFMELYLWNNTDIKSL